MSERVHMARQLAQQDQQLRQQQQQIDTQRESIARLLQQQNDLLKKHKATLERLLTTQQELLVALRQRNAVGEAYTALWQQTLVVCEQAILTLPPGAPVRVAAEVLLEGRCRQCGEPLTRREERHA